MADYKLKIYVEHDDLPNYKDLYQSEVPQDDDIPKKVQKVLKRYKVPKEHWNHVMRLLKFEIVLCIDNSGSMKSEVEEGKTRWQECQEMAETIIDLGCALDDDGVDVHLLNPLRNGKSDWLNITKYDPEIFSEQPSGGTPLASVTQQVFVQGETSEKPILFIIFTDGKPTDATPAEYRDMIRERDGSKVFITFVACTADDNDVAYLNGIDKNDCTIEVIDDYASEKEQVREAQGEDEDGNPFKYSRGLHVIRILLSPVIEQYDLLDEEKVDDWDFYKNDLE